MIDLWKVVLPRSRTLSLIIEKTLRRFFGALSYPQDFRDEADRTYKQLDPQFTDALEDWEAQFYLKNSGLTEQERRDRLEATWKLTGGQSPAYLQSVLRGYGFDVYVHDWWIDQPPGSLVMGDNLSFMGDQYSFMGEQASVSESPWDPNIILVPPYYPLVNKISTRQFTTITMGYQNITMGYEESVMGNVVGSESLDINIIPADPARWRYFYYIAGEVMPNQATVPLSRKDEFEELILSIFPAHLWGGIIVEYV